MFIKNKNKEHKVILIVTLFKHSINVTMVGCEESLRVPLRLVIILI